jgi:hypothetical protein
MSFDVDRYGPAVSRLWQIAAPYPLTPTQPVVAARQSLAALDHQQLFGDAPIADRTMADACLAGLWLWFDFLDESHTISQSIETTTGSFWHGIMHRREPDWGNAKYWFARVGKHPVYGELTAALSGIDQAAEHGLNGAWSAAKFVDLCERAASEEGPLEAFCRQVQVVEWQLLFDFCYRQSVGQR